MEGVIKLLICTGMCLTLATMGCTGNVIEEEATTTGDTTEIVTEAVIGTGTEPEDQEDENDTDWVPNKEEEIGEVISLEDERGIEEGGEGDWTNYECYLNFGCFGFPIQCEKNGDCEAMMTYQHQAADGKFKFILEVRGQKKTTIHANEKT